LTSAPGSGHSTIIYRYGIVVLTLTCVITVLAAGCVIIVRNATKLLRQKNCYYNPTLQEER